MESPSSIGHQSDYFLSDAVNPQNTPATGQMNAPTVAQVDRDIDNPHPLSPHYDTALNHAMPLEDQPTRPAQNLGGIPSKIKFTPVSRSSKFLDAVTKGVTSNSIPLYPEDHVMHGPTNDPEAPLKSILKTSSS